MTDPEVAVMVMVEPPGGVWALIVDPPQAETTENIATSPRASMRWPRNLRRRLPPKRKPAAKPKGTQAAKSGRALEPGLVPWLRAEVVPVVVMIRVEVPALDPETATVCGLKEQVARTGNPEQLRLTVPLKPFCAARLTAKLAEPPAMMVALSGIGSDRAIAGGPASTATD